MYSEFKLSGQSTQNINDTELSMTLISVLRVHVRLSGFLDIYDAKQCTQNVCEAEQCICTKNSCEAEQGINNMYDYGQSTQKVYDAEQCT